MSNTIFIKEVNNTPYIFNVDNAVDAARLEALQAVKMAEDMITNIFGEQSNFADNTTCTISANQDNPAFPFAVNFDASKIIETPKRYYGYLAQMAMPSSHYIDYTSNFGTSTSISKVLTAPANGYISLSAITTQANGFANMCLVTTPNLSDIDDSKKYMVVTSTYGSINVGIGCYLPILKGQHVLVHTGNSRILWCRFYYAQGEI